MKKQRRVLTKFINVENNKPVYIDLSLVSGIEAEIKYTPYVPNYGSMSNTATIVPQEVSCTRLTMDNGSQFMVMEHYLELLALVEGRSPGPAQVIYGRKT